MRIVETYSHLNGLEYLQVRCPRRWEEIEGVISSVDARKHKVKVSRERRKKGELLYSPDPMNKEFKEAFWKTGWFQSQNHYWVTKDAKLIRRTMNLSADEQRVEIEEAGHTPIGSWNQTDFVKERIAIEVQFGKYAFVAYDLFVKHMAFFVRDLIDVGVEILPMKEMQREMSSGIAYYERELYNLIRQGRGIPAVPLVLVGIAA